MLYGKDFEKEEKVVASISCSGHGRAFLDGLLLHDKPLCECNTCYGGTDCSHRMIMAYCQSAVTLNLLRAFAIEGYVAINAKGYSVESPFCKAVSREIGACSPS